MTENLSQKIITDLTLMYKDQPTFNADKMTVIVQKVIDEIVQIRRYRDVGYTDVQIENDLRNFQSNIYSIAEYDFAQFGAPYESSHSENSTSRTWVNRNKLFAGIVSLAKF